MIGAAALLAAALAGTPTPPARSALPDGGWGGPDVALTVTRDGGTLDFACAHGSLGEPIVPDEAGRFEARGVYVAERPGPVRPEDVEGKKARYVGRVSGKSMTLSVFVSGSDDEIGPFTLERGRLPRVIKCR